MGNKFKFNFGKLFPAIIIIVFLIPDAYGQLPTDSVMIDVNRFKMPINNIGTLGDQLIGGQSVAGGKYDGQIVLFSGGFMMSGKSNGFLWANSSYTDNRILDYVPGRVGTIPNDPGNILYVVRGSDPEFGESWQQWKAAVSQGADFYDGNHDGLYNPVDQNANGRWDADEDRPDLLGDVTAWCVYNDGVPANKRSYSDVNPQGIEIQQTVFAQKDSGYLNNIIFVRYRLINRGTIADVLESVYFGSADDIDIGDSGANDLVGCDTLLNTAYIYHHVGSGDMKFGVNPPAELVTEVQGPITYINGITFTDLNGNGIYDAGIDIPIDTGYSYQGPLIGKKIYPGAKNLNMTASIEYPGGTDASNRIQANFYLNGKNNQGFYFNPCGGGGQVFGEDCSNVNPLFVYSGDPVNQTGWINNTPADQRLVMSSGPFRLEKNKPVDIIVGHIVGRGSDGLNSITVAKGYAASAINYCKSNFPNSIITGVKGLPNTVTDFRLEQNYPNPFNPSTKINYSLPKAGNVKLTVYNALGSKVLTIVDEYKPAGNYSVQFNGGILASGIYLYRLESGKFNATKKFILLK
jgi:hypothetical protein